MPTSQTVQTIAAINTESDSAASRNPLHARNDEPLHRVVKKMAPKLTKAKHSTLLTKEQLMAMRDADYMNADQLDFFRDKLRQLGASVAYNDLQTSGRMRENEAASDPVDRASMEESHAMGLLTRDRDTKLYAHVSAALARMETGDYGWCQDTGEPIGLARLLAQPTALLTTEAQHRREIKKKTYAI